MKCTNCGKNDVTFYYESNVNGQITRKQLCSECAQKLGFGTDNLFESTRSMFDSMLGDFAEIFGTRRRMFPFGGMTLPTMLMPRLAMPGTVQSETREQAGNEQCACEHCQSETETQPRAEQTPADADGEMNKRRQINMLRAQMYEAVQSENFEKAAQLRDQIKDLEK